MISKHLKKTADRSPLAIGLNNFYYFHVFEIREREIEERPSTYAASGVDIDRGERLVDYIKKTVRSTFSDSVLGDVGAFGAFYDARFKGLKSPVLVSSVDGVGTKLKIAQMMGKHDTIGQDLVNHCVNDIAVCGARPLYFMDYLATGKLDETTARQIIDGFVRACKENSCSLIGGETAEMPGFYDENEYDLAGMIVGVVERKRIISGKKVKKGDILIGIPSTGLHTNGYSLARAVLLKHHAVTDRVQELGSSLGDALLSVHRSYLAIINSLKNKFPLHALSHITGGGIVGNTMRVVPKGLSLDVHWHAWERPAIFSYIQKLGNVPEDDMRRTFNLGVGLVAIVSRKDETAVLKHLDKKGERGFVIGRVISAH